MDNDRRSRQLFLARMAGAAGALLVPAVTSFGLTGATAAAPAPAKTTASSSTSPSQGVLVPGVPVVISGGTCSVDGASNTTTTAPPPPPPPLFDENGMPLPPVVFVPPPGDALEEIVEEIPGDQPPLTYQGGGSTNGKAPSTSRAVRGADPAATGGRDSQGGGSSNGKSTADGASNGSDPSCGGQGRAAPTLP